MNPENPSNIEIQIDPEKQEFTKEQEIDREYQEWLSTHTPVNAGMEALIYKISAYETPMNLKLLFESEQASGDSAVKLLKIYKPEKAKNEFDWQQRVYNLIQSKIKSNPETIIAKVPKPLDNREIDLGNDGSSPRKAGLLTMDFVPGYDLQHIFYRWILDHANEQFDTLKDNTDPEKFEELHRAVSIVLSFGELPPRGTPGADTEIAVRRKKILTTLKRTGFNLSPKILEKIHNTRVLLEKNDIYHNDDHERNFMLVGNPDDPNAEVYIIDFAAAGNMPAEDQTRFLIEEHLRELTPAVEQQVLKLPEFESCITNQVWIRNQPGFFAKAEQAIPDDIIRDRLAKTAMTAASTEQSFENYVAVMFKLVRDNRLQNVEAKNYLDQIRFQLRIKNKQGTKIMNPNIYNKAEGYKALFN